MQDDAISELTFDQRAAAILLAERTVEHGVRHGEPLEPADSIAGVFPDAERASFVSVYVREQLNGCVGTLQATRRLEKGIVHNAYRAAFHDQRFPAVEPEHLDALDVAISVLHPPEPIPVRSEHEIWEYVEPGRHGLLLQSEDHRGTFLPSVWKKFPDPGEFLANLKKKAGLAPDAWPDDLAVFRYTTDQFDRESLGTT